MNGILVVDSSYPYLDLSLARRLAAAQDWVTRLRRSKSWSDAELAAAGIAFR
jgi:hypothetical protein